MKRREGCTASRLQIHNKASRFNSYRWPFIFMATVVCSYLLTSSFRYLDSTSATRNNAIHVLQPISSKRASKDKSDPAEWLRKHSNLNHYETGKEMFNSRPKAAIISLVRNEELDGILQSMTQLEWHWNKRYNYPWMFFSETPFTEDFKVFQRPAIDSSLTSFRMQRPTRHQPRRLTISFRADTGNRHVISTPLAFTLLCLT